MILAGGLSTRLQPLTNDLPKPLVPVLDRPVVGHVIDYLHGFGVDDLVVNVHYHADAVERFIGDGSDFGVRMTYLREETLLGSAGAVKQVEERFQSTFVVIGCDDVTDVDLTATLGFHRARRAEATIVLHEAEDVTQYGVVITDSEGRILDFQEKPARGTERGKLANTGIYIFEPSVLSRIPAGTFYDFGKQVFPGMLASEARFFGVRQNAYWCDIGTPSEYRRAHFDALGGRVKLTPGSGSIVRDGVLFGRGASVDDSARIEGPACIGASSVVEVGAVIESSILWRGVRVGSGARVSNAVFADDVVIEAGSVVEGGEYGRGERISTECTGRPLTGRSNE
ncbi:MAG TPA: NDP-sugar synthase [Candidatus Eremiobacteraceae bacterium]|nr:NDP-sugar synthase [Candidatus Eremiobacteraceae bacterium]